MRISFAIIAAVSLWGCKTVEDGIVGKPPPTGAAVSPTPAAAPAPERPRLPPARLTLATWPYMEHGLSFKLTWTGGNHRAVLYEEPDLNAPLLGDVVWDNGERILWQDTAVASYSPRVVRAKEEWFVEGPVHDDGFLVDQEFVQLDVKKGDRVEIWAYAGDLQCYMSRRSKIILGPCPPADRFSGLGTGPVPAEWYMPERKVWWIQISANNVGGWLAVDDRISVDLVEQ